jgi:hypothetical protein
MKLETGKYYKFKHSGDASQLHTFLILCKDKREVFIVENDKKMQISLELMDAIAETGVELSPSEVELL